MKPRPIIIHFHFHRKRTGVTRSIENVFSFFDEKFDAFIYGYGVAGRKISFVKLLKLVISKTFFVIHCHRNNEIIRALLFRLVGGNFKLIATRHAETPPSVITKYLLKKSDIIVALTKSMAKALPFPSAVIGHGVNQQLFSSNPGVEISGIAQENILTCAGRVREAKGQKVLLEVMAPILRGSKNWALAIIGKVDNPAFLKELKTIVSKNSVEEQVYFIEETPDIISYYQASHSVIVPSFSEGFSLVCAEAMSCGCNIIASRDVGVHSDMISDGENGYLFDINDKKELGNLLSRLCKNNLVHLGEKAQKEISEKWSSKIEAENLMKLYE